MMQSQDKPSPAYIGLLLAFALILSYVESLLPLSFGVPGMKLGLSNFAVVLALYLYGAGPAGMITILKAVLSGFMFGNLTTIFYSLGGAIVSYLAMCLMRKSNLFSICVVSAGGGIAHNLGQLLVAAILMTSYGLIYYLPILMISGLVTGLVIGFLAQLVLPYITKFKRENTT